jgi:DNA-binding GntR family transcriptional regulator
MGAPFSVYDARVLLGLRRVFVAACVDAAAATPSAPRVQALDTFRKLTLAKGEDRAEAFIKYNRAFHSAVCHSSGNARMARIGVDLIEQMERMIRFSVAAVPREDKGVLLQEHGEIIDAIQAGNRRRAARLVKHHILEAQKRVIGGLRSAAIHV